MTEDEAPPGGRISMLAKPLQQSDRIIEMVRSLLAATREELEARADGALSKDQLDQGQITSAVQALMSGALESVRAEHGDADPTGVFLGVGTALGVTLSRLEQAHQPFVLNCVLHGFFKAREALGGAKPGEVVQ